MKQGGTCPPLPGLRTTDVTEVANYFGGFNSSFFSNTSLVLFYFFIFSSLFAWYLSGSTFPEHGPCPRHSLASVVLQFYPNYDSHR